MNRVLAIDLGGTKTAGAVVDPEGRISNFQKLPSARTLADSVAQIASLTADRSAAGVAVPGIYDANTGQAWAPNLWGDEFVPLRAALENALRIPVAIVDDRVASVTGERWLGVARGIDDVLFVTVGTGIGVGILAGGRVITGAHGIAGAAGWMEIGGVWESIAAGPAITARGDIQKSAELLGIGIANLISILDPELVVLGGGAMQRLGGALEQIRAEALRRTQPVAAKSVRIALSELGENAALLGAALAAHELTNHVGTNILRAH